MDVFVIFQIQYSDFHALFPSVAQQLSLRSRYLAMDVTESIFLTPRHSVMYDILPLTNSTLLTADMILLCTKSTCT
jgi:hypothetical protein